MIPEQFNNPNLKEALLPVLMVALAVCAGVIRYFEKISGGKVFLWREFFFEVISSIFTSIIVYLLAKGLNANDLVAVGISGVASYFGTRSLEIVYRHLGAKKEGN